MVIAKWTILILVGTERYGWSSSYQVPAYEGQIVFYRDVFRVTSPILNFEAPNDTSETA